MRLMQTITYWKPKGTDLYGARTFFAPKTIQARWEDRFELIRDKTGEEVTSRSRVYVGEDIDINGYLFNGFSNNVDPRTVSEALEVRALTTIPDLRNLKQLRVAYL